MNKPPTYEGPGYLGPLKPATAPRSPAAAEKTDGAAVVHRADLKHSNFTNRLIAVLVGSGFSLASLGGVAFAYDKLETKAADAGSQAAQLQLAPVVEAVKAHEARLQAVEQRTTATQADVHEARGELRDIYKAVMQGQRSERLERPLPPIDGGNK